MQPRHQTSIQNKTCQHQQQALHTKGKHAKQKTTTKPNKQTKKQHHTQKNTHHTNKSNIFLKKNNKNKQTHINHMGKSNTDPKQQQQTNKQRSIAHKT